MLSSRANRVFAVFLPLMLVLVSTVVLGSGIVENNDVEHLFLPAEIDARMDTDWLYENRLGYLPTGDTGKYMPGFTVKRYHEGASLRADLMTYGVETGFGVKKVADPSLEKGKTKVVVQGRKGLLLKTVVETRIGMKLLSREKVSERIISRPVTQVVHYGTKEPLRKLVTKSGTYYYRKSFVVTATAYEPSEVSCGEYADGFTAIGLKAGPGIIAVDPRVIPLRSKVYVQGYGYAIAGDVGGAIKGNRIDVCFNTVREALDFGRRRVRIYILEDPSK
ncbi:MAG TPA: 3D domain-containing protein [Bacillota bacterium]|nr:3D domain-containing protein [Bacillota bacterium]